MFICIIFTACKNCSDRTMGYVVDKESLYALDSVQVRSYGALDRRREDERLIFTDSTGYFEAFFSSKSTAKCPVLKLEISRLGYKTIRFSSHKEGDTIRLEKIE